MKILSYEAEVRNELLDYLNYLYETTSDLVTVLAEKFQLSYENLSSLSIEKLRDVVNYYDSLDIAW